MVQLNLVSIRGFLRRFAKLLLQSKYVISIYAVALQYTDLSLGSSAV
jgi:hypothetical protein